MEDSEEDSFYGLKRESCDDFRAPSTTYVQNVVFSFSLCRTIVDTIDRYNLEGTEEKFEKVQCSNLKF